MFDNAVYFVMNFMEDREAGPFIVSEIWGTPVGDQKDSITIPAKSSVTVLTVLSDSYDAIAYRFGTRCRELGYASHQVCFNGTLRPKLESTSSQSEAPAQTPGDQVPYAFSPLPVPGGQDDNPEAHPDKDDVLP